jgi:hypothetical protein
MRIGAAASADLLGILSGTANPAVWLCWILAFSTWKSAWPSAVMTGWLIAFTFFLVLKAISLVASEQSAREALTALAICRSAYDIEACRPLDVLIGEDGPKADLSKTQLPLDSGVVYRLKPKPGNEPLLTFKAFLQPTTESVFLLPLAARVGIAERFFLLHEVGHSAWAGQIAQLNAQWAWLRLGLVYLPLLLISANWKASLSLTLIFAINLLWEAKNEILIEGDADWNAWKAYHTVFGAVETINTTILMARLFDLKAKLNDDPRQFRVRADLARYFGAVLAREGWRRRRKILSMNSLSLGFVGSISFVLQVVAAIIVYLSASQSQSFVLMPLVVVAMWVALILVRKVSKSARNKIYELWALNDVMKIIYGRSAGADARHAQTIAE